MNIVIKNRSEVIEQLAELLKTFDRQLNSFQTDVYMYVDDAGVASLDTFVNVGGNSWLNDDHYTIYSDKQRYDTMLDFWTTIGDLAGALEVEHDTLISDAAAYYDIDIEDVEWYEVAGYIRANEDLIDKLQLVYDEYLDEQISEYIDNAEQIFSAWEKKQEEDL